MPTFTGRLKSGVTKKFRIVANPRLRRRKLGFRKRKLARTNFSKRRIGLNRQIFKAMRNYGETKLVPTINVSPSGDGDALGVPNARMVGGQGGTPQSDYYYAAILGGSLPLNWDPNIRKLGGLSIAEGVKNNERIGDYVWLKKTHLTMQLEMQATTNPLHCPIQFRLIVVKQRAATVPTGLVYHPEASLFIQNDGTNSGYESNGGPTADVRTMNAFQVQNMPLNKRNWVVFRDQRFQLSPPAPSDGNANNFYSSRLPTRKNITINLNHFKKTKYQDVDGDNKNKPLNYDGRYLVFIFAQSMGIINSQASAWQLHMTGTTSFTDM